jgi:pre-mRNA-splicing factor ATP-dependent RNA helicase DHX16
MRGLGTKIAELIICLIYANLTIELQSKLFGTTPEGAGIKYVIDPGFCKIEMLQ